MLKRAKELRVMAQNLYYAVADIMPNEYLDSQISGNSASAWRYVERSASEAHYALDQLVEILGEKVHVAERRKEYKALIEADRVSNMDDVEF